MCSTQKVDLLVEGRLGPKGGTVVDDMNVFLGAFLKEEMGCIGSLGLC